MERYAHRVDALRALLPVAAAWLGVVGCRPPSPGPLGHAASAAFVEVTEAAGIRFQYDNDATPHKRYIETTGGGCAFLDFDNDGLLDIVLVQGGPAPGSPARSRPPHALYRNLGNGRFQDVAQEAGLAQDLGYAQGVCAADFDNDGWTDLLITTYGGPRLLKNHKGRFEEVTARAGLRLAGEPHWTLVAAWADYDRDGWLDLFVGNYVSWFPDIDRPCVDGEGRRIYCQPFYYAGDRSWLFRNRRDGTFEDVSAKAGLANLEGAAMGAVWTDIENDGWPDLFVAHDLRRNWLLHNLRGKGFAEVAWAAGVAAAPSGRPLSGMGVAAGDYFGSGREDLFVVNFSKQPRSLFKNDGGGMFHWFGPSAGVGDPNQLLLGWGCEALDYNLDGHLDIVVGNAHINDVIPDTPEGTGYRQRQQLLRNTGSGFVDDEAAAGDLRKPRTMRGLAVGDYDNDGLADVLLSGPDTPAGLFRNVARPHGNWLGLRLQGVKSNRDGIGARVRLAAAGRTQFRLVRSGSSYCSSSDPRLLFGLANAVEAETVRVEWPSGQVDEVRNLAANRYYLLREGGAITAQMPRSAPTRAKQD